MEKPPRIEKTPVVEKGKELIDGAIEFLLLDADKVNEGNNGIIKRVDANKLPASLADYLRQINPRFMSEHNSLAIKILKIYTSGEGKHEYEMQRQSYELISKRLSACLPLAKIPEPLFYKELTIKNEDIKEKLRNEGLQTFDDKIEVIIMDFIPGDDLATHLYRQVVKAAEQDPTLTAKVGHQNLMAEDMNLSELQESVNRILDFRKAGGKHRDANLNEFEEEAVKLDNAEKLRNFLKKRGYVMNKEWLEKINNTVALLHENGIYHRDLHERNVIIDELEDEIHLLDFGSAIVHRGLPSDKAIYEELGKRRPDDLNIVKSWGYLSTSIAEDKQNSLKKIEVELGALMKKISAKDPQAVKKLSVAAGGKNASIDRLTTEVAHGMTTGIGDTFWRIKAALILELAQSRPAEVLSCLSEEIDKQALSPFAKNLFVDLRNLIKK